MGSCKDFLKTYFDNKDPKPFDKFKQKYLMNKVKKVAARIERMHIRINADPNKTI